LVESFVLLLIGLAWMVGVPHGLALSVPASIHPFLFPGGLNLRRTFVAATDSHQGQGRIRWRAAQPPAMLPASI